VLDKWWNKRASAAKSGEFESSRHRQDRDREQRRVGTEAVLQMKDAATGEYSGDQRKGKKKRKKRRSIAS
jgi:hypothetical protein